MKTSRLFIYDGYKLHGEVTIKDKIMEVKGEDG